MLPDPGRPCATRSLICGNAASGHSGKRQATHAPGNETASLTGGRDLL